MIFNKNISALAKVNSFFRQAIITGSHMQVVVMSLSPGEDAGESVHATDQIVVVVEGEGYATVSGERESITAEHLVFIPAGAVHNFGNTGKTDLKLYVVYAPPHHKPGTIHANKTEAEAAQSLAI
jgi:mannose-6-phosphate isomerase-like protein (cupin superfamily)